MRSRSDRRHRGQLSISHTTEPHLLSGITRECLSQLPLQTESWEFLQCQSRGIPVRSITVTVDNLTTTASDDIASNVKYLSPYTSSASIISPGLQLNLAGRPPSASSHEPLVIMVSHSTRSQCYATYFADRVLSEFHTKTGSLAYKRSLLLRILGMYTKRTHHSHAYLTQSQDQRLPLRDHFHSKRLCCEDS